MLQARKKSTLFRELTRALLDARARVLYAKRGEERRAAEKKLKRTIEAVKRLANEEAC